MTAIVVNGSTPFGAISNEIVDNLKAVDQAITRLEAAVGQAASGYGGTAGTEFETGTNFGVVASATPGAQGTSWRFAVDTLSTAWTTFMTSASASIAALDNG